ncbi:MAG: hypothetical protein HY820_20130 [Acidobacteria bacterium]|nr:hypothetical protein [Acidobacteriota bacterium]
MLRRLTIGLLAVGLFSPAAVLTDNLGTAKRVSLDPLPVTDRAVWEEYGLAEAETAKFESDAGKFTVSGWRLKDPTGAQAAYRWMLPAGARPGDKIAVDYAPMSARAGNSQWMAFGNYVLKIEGRALTQDEMKILLFQLPKLDRSALPPVLEYMPKDGLIAGSDRFINGPASLEKFYSKVAPSTVGFHFGAEALVARFKSQSSEVEMAVFYYPTNPMARDREPEFARVPGAIVKRSGPLVAMVVAPANPDDAQRLLSLVNYKANVTLNEGAPGSKIAGMGNLLVTIFIMVGLLIALCLMAGVLMYGAKVMRRRMSGGKDDEPMTMLHIDR